MARTREEEWQLNGLPPLDGIYANNVSASFAGILTEDHILLHCNYSGVTYWGIARVIDKNHITMIIVMLDHYVMVADKDINNEQLLVQCAEELKNITRSSMPDIIESYRLVNACIEWGYDERIDFWPWLLKSIWDLIHECKQTKSIQKN